ncbi:MAG: PD-(D/E)XK nuclease family protein [Burkholderiales bacterium]
MLQDLIHSIADHLAARCQAQGASACASSLLTARTLVLVPYAQLMAVFKAQWAAQFGSGFVPRFETTSNWARSLHGFVPDIYDLSFDMARDRLVAQSLIEQAGLAARQDLLVGRVIEAAWQLASVACAQPPAQRSSWATAMQNIISSGLESPLLENEAAIARLAMTWAGTSAYASDILFTPSVAQSVDCLVVLDGLQSDPLTQALKMCFADRLLQLSLVELAPQGQISLHPAQSPEDEAERAAACVLRHIEAGRLPVALAATDRVLTRRASALLAGRGVLVRDETGWRLSTTRAAAQLMAALRACAFGASSDDVLDWLKHSSGFSLVDVLALEARLRKTGVRQWRDLPQAWGNLPPGHSDWPALELARQCVKTVNALRKPMQAAQSLAQWLSQLRVLLQASGQWPTLVADAAGTAVANALYLEDSAQLGLDGLPHAMRRVTLTEFTVWVNEVLEADQFEPQVEGTPHVVVLPLAQLLGRPFGALVLPGCDERHLPASPDPPGNWNTLQRGALGLPLRDMLQTAARAAFTHALQVPHVDVLWRRVDAAGEAVPASPLVLSFLLAQADAALAVATPDPRCQRLLPAIPTPRPQPNAAALLPRHLSASAYEDLRRCPYRFFALRQLGLIEVEEIDSALDKRDFGNWLHEVLALFHQTMQDAPLPPGLQRQQLLDSCATHAAQHMGLDEAEFLPFQSAWPKARDGYLAWLVEHEAQGHVFEAAESSREVLLENMSLRGQLDRIDRSAPADAGGLYLLDYKTESLDISRRRIKDGTENTQLLFYAALLPGHELRAAYINVGNDKTITVEQEMLAEFSHLLVQGIAADMQAIASGDSLPALGESPTCDTCAARGLCRKDFWNIP